MKSQLKAIAIIATCWLIVADWCTPNVVCAGTIKQLLDDQGGEITVATYTFTFTNTSVSGDRTSEQVSVAAVGNNGIEFTIDPELRLDSLGEGVAKNQSIDIDYTVTSSVPITFAGLDSNAFAQFKANGAFSQVTESLGNGSTLFFGSGDTQANVLGVNFAGVMTLTVNNAGRLHTPLRGPGPNQDEAQLAFITNTFSTIPEPSTALLLSFGLVGLAWRRRRL